VSAIVCAIRSVSDSPSSNDSMAEEVTVEERMSSVSTISGA
jgi:hypothetical protein